MGVFLEYSGGIAHQARPTPQRSGQWRGRSSSSPLTARTAWYDEAPQAIPTSHSHGRMIRSDLPSVTRLDVALELRSSDVGASPIFLRRERPIMDSVVELRAAHSQYPGCLGHLKAQRRQHDLRRFTLKLLRCHDSASLWTRALCQLEPLSWRDQRSCHLAFPSSLKRNRRM